MTRVVVLGDSVLDVDLEGHVDRVSPEAPVPVLDADDIRVRPGGAALAAVLAARDVDDVVLVTAVGADADGRRLVDLVSAHCTVAPLPLTGTTVTKTRVRTDVQHLLRIDSGDGVTADVAVPPAAAEALARADAVVVADYGRGTTRHRGLRSLLRSRAADVPVVWDPHPRGEVPPAECALVTPNLREAYGALGAGSEVLAPAEAARRLIEKWGTAAVAVTQGAGGAIVIERGRRPRAVPVPDVPVTLRVGRPDTCGAGDRFAAAAAAALATGASMPAAVAMAVDHASRFVSAGGAGAMATADRVGTSRRLHRPQRNCADACAVADAVRARGGRLIATGGCFDIVHPGHLRLLHQAAAFGDALIVCLNSDASVRRLKGDGRPVLGQDARAAMLRELDAVDAVAVFDDDTPARLLARLRPDVWVKGGDYRSADLPEADVVRRYGGDVRVVPVLGDYSTTKVVAAIASQREAFRDRTGLGSEGRNP
ncbi:PfkB family carbohydrate kinase [Rhodococcus sp. SGAir0479]|uniref:PfkB family carbohydrate kinase n=1 Tax=Rhodococcus sp. SGAir0479 TaxID=2567884 RepID=UPI0010CCEC8F|nr:PfkB family carbohydrate kinase [Rhodococcus sp. SGAir0479]QCQ91338.1 bifunctional heptose 7-phosphate kinase/heptose 1-phosphate adenyltransferase [Rhodococcus sp. SGAir0479]